MAPGRPTPTPTPASRFARDLGSRPGSFGRTLQARLLAYPRPMQPIAIAQWNEIPDREPVGALVDNVDLVIVRWDDNHSVLYGRCLHRGALLSDGHISGANLICGLHGWDYVYMTGVSAYNNAERLYRFSSWIEDGSVMIDADEIMAGEKEHPQPVDRSA